VTNKEKTPREEKKRTPSPMLASSYLKKFNNPVSKVPVFNQLIQNFSKISTGNLLNDKKFKDEQIEVQVTNNMRPKLQGTFSLPKKPTSGNFSGGLVKNETDNKIKTLDNHSNDNLTKEVDLRKITTSPIVIVYLILFRKNQLILKQTRS
jgi:hypothetical protein